MFSRGDGAGRRRRMPNQRRNTHIVFRTPGSMKTNDFLCTPCAIYFIPKVQEGGCRNGHGGRSLCFGASQYRWVRRQKALQSEAWVKCCFGCIKQKGTAPDLAPYDDEPRPLRHLRSEIAALRATLPDRPTGTTPRGLPAGTASPIPPAKHRGPGRLMSRKEGERPPREVPFSRATAGIAERGERSGRRSGRAPWSRHHQRQRDRGRDRRRQAFASAVTRRL